MAVEPAADPARMVTPRPPLDVAGAMAPEVPTMVTVGVPEICTSPEDADTIGMLNPGAEDHGLVAAVEVMDPEIWTSPDDAETKGMLNDGAEDQGFVAAVAVTVGTDDSVTIPDDRLVADESVTTPEVTLTVNPPDVVTTAIPDEVNPPMATTSR